MKRYLQPQRSCEPESKEPARKTKKEQSLLQELKGVVNLGKRGKFAVDAQRLQACAAVLTDKDSSTASVLNELRVLDSMVIHSQHLCSCPHIGKAVRSLRQHPDKQISTLATGLTSKWRAVVLSELPDNMQ